MGSQAQVIANRNNSLLSTGPTSAAGKAIVSQNARTHGLTGKFLLSNEDKAAFEELLAGLVNSHKPANSNERRLVEMHAQNAWRTLRLRDQEAAFIDRAVKQVRDAEPEFSYDDAFAALLTDPVHMAKMRLFLRYQSAIERAYAKSLKELMDTQKERMRQEYAERKLALLRKRAEQDRNHASRPSIVPTAQHSAAPLQSGIVQS